ncbi:hypothetical protein O0L34_g3526 [Tuta absoluta]|nr:hypothetical protein O0L34_g3526 [Tuta absoluta]
MTSDELRHVFHVDHHSQVPEYHLVHLSHHLARRNIPTSHHTNSHSPTSSKIPHEKYQKAKKNWKTETSPPSLLNDEMFVKAKEMIKDVDIIGDLNSTVSVNFDVSKSSESDSESSEVNSDSEDLMEVPEDVHRIELEAFGRPLKLNLKKQEGLFKKEGLKMWRALKNESQPHGVDYEELQTVS